MRSANGSLKSKQCTVTRVCLPAESCHEKRPVRNLNESAFMRLWIRLIILVTHAKHMHKQDFEF